jgi:hypothetical protein
LGCLLCVGSLVLFSPWMDTIAYWSAIGAASGAIALIVIVLMRLLGFGWHSAPVVYIGFVWMFHFPLALFLPIFPDLWARLNPTIYSWTQNASWPRAALYALLCVAAFAMGCGLAANPRRRTATAGSPNTLRFQVGVVTAFGGLGWLYYLMFRAGGLDLFGSGYLQLFTTVFGSSFTTAIFFVSVGCLLAVVSAPARLVWLPVVLQLACSVPVLLTGSRQFALIGPLVLAVVAARRGLRPGFAGTTVACVLMLWMISYVGETRNRGVVESVSAGPAVSPVGALVEMGASLETTSMAFDWIQNGDSYLLGGSYWLPFERGLGLMLPVRQELETDSRAMHMVMVSRVSGLGGSAIAESYYNFSAFGALFFVALGILLTRLDLGQGGLSADLIGVVLYAFLFQARNWFISVPRFLLLGLLPLLVCLCIEAVLRRREVPLFGAAMAEGACE